MTDASFPAAATRVSRALALLSLLFAAVVAALYVSPEMLDRDEGIFSAGAARVRELGVGVYDAAWDLKPPGVFLAHAAAQLLPAPPLLAGHLLAATIWVATAAFLGVTASRLLRSRAAFPAAVIAYALLRSGDGWKSGAANSEAFLQLPLAAGIALVVTSDGARRLAAGGALLGLAAWFKWPVLLYGPACVLGVGVVRGLRPAAVAAAWAGGACVVAIVVLAAASVGGGGFDGFWLCNVTANRLYLEHGPDAGTTGAAAQILRKIVATPAPWLLAASALVAWTARGEAVAKTRGLPGPRAAAVAVLLVLAGLAMVSAGGNFYGHYWWMMHPVLAVLAAAGWCEMTRSELPRTRRVALGAVAVAIVAAGWLPAQWRDKRRMAANPAAALYRDAAVDAAVAAIRRHSAPGDGVFVWGISPHLPLLAERTPATRFVTCAFLVGFLHADARSGGATIRTDLVPEAWPQLLADLRAERPRLIVDTSPTGWSGWDRYPVDAFPELARHLADDYVRVEEAGGCVLYRRRE